MRLVSVITKHFKLSPADQAAGVSIITGQNIRVGFESRRHGYRMRIVWGSGGSVTPPPDTGISAGIPGVIPASSRSCSRSDLEMGQNYYCWEHRNSSRLPTRLTTSFCLIA